MYSTGPQQAMPASYPNVLTEPVIPPQSPLDTAVAKTTLPPGAKEGVLQQISLTETWLPRGSTGFGMNTVGVATVLGFPFPERDTPLILTPAFDTNYLDGPDTPDLPARVYDAQLQIRHLRKLAPRFGMDLAITPGWHSDFEPDEPKAFRLPARAVGAFDWTPTTQLVLGIAYLDREDVNFLPVGGLIYTPSDDTRVEAIFPKPRLARRFQFDGTVETWAYVSGEFGGGSYAIERTSGAFDVVTISDLRLLFGLERKVAGGISSRLEVGYVFDRKIEYLSGTPDFDPNDTALLRGMIYY
jgi:hypothetical protein